MALIENTKHKLQIPHEQTEENGGPHWVEIRKLSGAEMDKAKDAQMDKLLERADQIGALQGKAPEQTDAEKNSIEARRQVYEPGTLIQAALVAWSYPVDIGPDPQAQIDGMTRDWLWNTIVEENTRPPEPSPSGGPS